MQSELRFAVVVLVCARVACSLAADPPEPVWTIIKRVGAPSHALYDPTANVLLVSQISGEGDQKDGVGVISRIGLDGRPIDMEWVAGLDAPKGLARSGKTLWVSDIDRLHEIDLETGMAVDCHAVRGARFLSGVTVDPAGVVYVADMLASAIYTFQDGRATLFLRGAPLESPAGLLATDGRLVVAAWGLTTDYTTEVPGRFYILEDRKPRPLSKSLGNLYGIVADGAHGWIGSDFASGRIFHITRDAEPRELLALDPGVAGIEYIASRKLLIVPELTSNRISAFDLTARLKNQTR